MTIPDALSRLSARLEGEKSTLGGPYDLCDGWAYATDGHGLLFVRTCLAAAPPPLPPDGKQGAAILPYLRLTDALTEPARLPLADLAAFCGPPVWSEPCPACKGTSKGSAYVFCSFCEGDGIVGPPPRPGFLCGQALDRNRLACLLEAFACPTVSPTLVEVAAVPRPGEGKGAFLVVRAPRWRALLMGMQVHAHDPEGAKAWAEAPRLPGAGG